MRATYRLDKDRSWTLLRQRILWYWRKDVDRSSKQLLDTLVYDITFRFEYVRSWGSVGVRIWDVVGESVRFRSRGFIICSVEGCEVRCFWRRVESGFVAELVGVCSWGSGVWIRVVGGACESFGCSCGRGRGCACGRARGCGCCSCSCGFGCPSCVRQGCEFGV